MKRHTFKIAGAVFLLAAVLCAPATAQRAEVATANVAAGSLYWNVQVGYDGLKLTVAGEGRYVARTFEGGETPSFSVFDAEGEPLADGTYKWELVVLPKLAELNPEEFENLRSSVDGAELRAARAPQRQAAHGTFTVRGGQIVNPDLTEGPVGGPAGQGNVLSTKDVVFNDDLIVRGSACIGFDCVNGESFGFDTIRLKENNLRIKFDDTSTTGSFPSNDWQLTANDSANGGLNHFSIDDVSGSRTPFRVEAGAPSNSLYVESDGDVGFGTANPIVRLHAVDGDTPALRLEQDGSSGFTPQTFDIAGNESNFFVRDATNGSTLPFRIRPGAPTSSIDIAANGNVGIGTASPDANADITVESGETAAILMRKAGAVRFRLANTTAGTEWDTNNDGSGDFSISLVGTGKSEFEIEQNGNVGLGCGNPDHDLVISGGPACTATPRSWIDAGDTGFSITSSRTLKEHLVPLAADGIVEKVSSIPVYEFDFIDGPQDRIGLLAEDFHTIFGRGSDKEISSHEMQVAMWLAIQELAAENDRLERELQELRQGQ